MFLQFLILQFTCVYGSFNHSALNLWYCDCHCLQYYSTWCLWCYYISTSLKRLHLSFFSHCSRFGVLLFEVIIFDTAPCLVVLYDVLHHLWCTAIIMLRLCDMTAYIEYCVQHIVYWCHALLSLMFAWHVTLMFSETHSFEDWVMMFE